MPTFNFKLSDVKISLLAVLIGLSCSDVLVTTIALDKLNTTTHQTCQALTFQSKSLSKFYKAFNSTGDHAIQHDHLAAGSKKLILDRKPSATQAEKDANTAISILKDCPSVQ